MLPVSRNITGLSYHRLGASGFLIPFTDHAVAGNAHRYEYRDKSKFHTRKFDGTPLL